MKFCLRCKNIGAMVLMAMLLPAFGKAMIVRSNTDGGTSYNTRNIKIQLINSGNSTIALSGDTVDYAISDTDMNLQAQTYYFMKKQSNGTVTGWSPQDVSISIIPTLSQTNQIKGNQHIRFTFPGQDLCSGCVIEFGIGVHRSDWSQIIQTNDPSFIPSFEFVENQMITWSHNSYIDRKNIIDSFLTKKMVNLDKITWLGSLDMNFSDSKDSLTIYKFINADSSFKIALSKNDKLANIDSIIAFDRHIHKMKFGGLDPRLSAIVDTLSADNSVLVSYFNSVSNSNYSNVLEFTAQHNGTCSQTGICKVLLKKNDLISLRSDTTFPITILNEKVKVVPDLWSAAYRMNVDNFLSFGFNGTGVRSCIWEQPNPNFDSQMDIDLRHFEQANLGFCYSDNAMNESDCNNAGNHWYKTSSFSVCLAENYLPQSSCNGANMHWNDESSNPLNQHVAYMLSMVKNKRLNVSAPTGSATTFGGTGLAPSSFLMLANFPSGLSAYGHFQQSIEALKWATSNNADVVSQSWHNDVDVTPTAASPFFGSSLANSDEAASVSYMDRMIDYIAQQPPYPVICQAAGNLGATANPIVVHKGFNTIVVGQDNRDGYAMVSASSYKNASNGAELPHVTAGVNVTLDGVTPFDDATSTAHVFTKNGGTSMAAAMANGFATDLISINPTLLKNKPWLIRAILMASADNVEATWWDSKNTIDKRGGAGRLNGINAEYIARNPYNGTSASGFGFSNEVILSSSKSEMTFAFTAQRTGLFRAALSWFGNVNAIDFTEDLSDLDLSLIDSEGNIIASSASLLNPVEMLHCNVVGGKKYTLKVTTSTPVKYDTKFGIAWCNR